MALTSVVSTSISKLSSGVAVNSATPAISSVTNMRNILLGYYPLKGSNGFSIFYELKKILTNEDLNKYFEKLFHQSFPFGLGIADKVCLMIALNNPFQTAYALGFSFSKDFEYNVIDSNLVDTYGIWIDLLVYFLMQKIDFYGADYVYYTSLQYVAANKDGICYDILRKYIS